jgi:HAMP domain-containing protein
MKILTQNLLAITPLYLALALSGGYLMHNSEMNEMLWGLRQEASTVAGMTAGFLDSEKMPLLYEKGSNSEYSKELRIPMERIMGLDRVRAIYFISPDEKQIAFDMTSGASGKIEESFGNTKANLKALDQIRKEMSENPDLFKRISDRKIYITSAPKILDDAHARIYAYAPVRDANDNWIGTIRAELSANAWLALKRSFGAMMFRMSFLVTLLGIGIAFFLSNLISREVDELSAAATDVTGGNLDRQIHGGRIQELNDLTNTFNTMSDVLRETLVKNKRSIIESEQFRGDNELAQVHKEIFSPLIAKSLGSIRVVAEHLGTNASGSFFSTIQNKTHSFAIIGRLEQNHDIDAVLDASGASAYLQQMLRDHSPREAIEDANRLFHLHCADVISWPDRAERIEITSYHSADNAIQQETRKLDRETPLVLATFRGASLDQIKRYAQLFGHLTPDELIEDIKIVLPPDLEGSIMILNIEN